MSVDNKSVPNIRFLPAPQDTAYLLPLNSKELQILRRSIKAMVPKAENREERDILFVLQVRLLAEETYPKEMGKELLSRKPPE